MSDVALVEPAVREPTLSEELEALGEDGIFEFVNLREEDTGVPGVVFLPTELGRHGPRVKFYSKAGRDQPSFSVSISAEPRVLANSLPVRELNRAAPQVLAWVRINHELLLRFWSEGEVWDIRQLSAFTSALKPLGRN